MKLVTFYSKDDLLKRIHKRPGERKFGEALGTISNWEELQSATAKFVLLGIPEDVGVRANFGKPGTAKAWDDAMDILCNIQDNYLTKAAKLLVLGEVDCDPEMKSASRFSNQEAGYVEKLGELVKSIDEKVTATISKIISAGKFPIIVGGGHNNCYGNLKGAAEALGQAVNCLNFDAHTDFRRLEHRHSGNGFSYVFEEGYLDRYFTFGLHRNYTSQAVFERLSEHSDRVRFNLFEDIEINETWTFSEAMQEANSFINNKAFGLELDLDAIEDMGSSAMTPGGFSIHQARKFVTNFSKKEKCIYLHICEGAPLLGSFPTQVGKTISFLISDVIA